MMTNELSILGLGTSAPSHTMSQLDAAQMATEICCQTERQKRMLQVLYRKAGVKQRHTVLPHRIALSWIGDEGDSDHDVMTVKTKCGPTTGERTKFYEDHAAPLALQAARDAVEESAIQPPALTPGVERLPMKSSAAYAIAQQGAVEKVLETRRDTKRMLPAHSHGFGCLA